MYILLKSMVCVTYRFSGAGGCVSGGQLCLDVVFTSGVGECLHTTGLCFGRFVTMSSSVLYEGAS
jgi:hypothetical protein